MQINFKFEKALQALAYVLSLRPGKRMEYFSLLKMLYIADRQSMQETGYPITTDVFVAMKLGPTLSITYNNIKGTEKRYAKQFAQYIKRDRFSVALIQDPGVSKLSEYEMKKLKAVYMKYRTYSGKKLTELTHEFGEWKKNNPGNSSRRIEIEDMLDELGIPDRKEVMLEDLKARVVAERV